MPALLNRFRSALSSSAARRAAGVSFCDDCSQVCDSACRAESHRDRIRSSVLPSGRTF